MKRIVFLDYVRVFACFLVMLVHASEVINPQTNIKIALYLSELKL